MSSHHFAVRAFLTFIVLLVWATLGQPQGPPDLLQWSFTMLSPYCKEGMNCDGCTDTEGSLCGTFQVPSTGWYILCATAYSALGWSCGHCQSCAKIYDGTSVLADVRSRCGGTDCTNQAAVRLTQGVTYKLCVCLIPCLDQTLSCETCTGGQYQAKGKVIPQFGGEGCD